MKCSSSNKFLVTDGLRVLQNFLGRTETIVYEFVKSSKSKQKMVTPERRAVMKLLAKKDKDKRFISNWRTISLLNVDYI